MPKAYKRRSTRSTFRSRISRYYRSPEFPLVQLAVLALLAGLLLTGIIISIQSFFSSSQYSVVGPPTITTTQINHILERYHSPASGKGEALYDYGKQFGIDPAYALAFFMHESTFGTQGMAVHTHSLGNIRALAGQPAYHGYRYYATWELGFEDWYRLISQQYVSQWGLSTVDQIIPVYAPADDNNDEAAYIQSVKNAVDTWRSGKVVVLVISHAYKNALVDL